MNVIFPVITLTSVIFILFKSPEALLETFDVATQKTVELSISLIAVYCVWQGLSALLEKSGLSNKISKVLNKPIKKLFGVKKDETVYQISLNLTANALGISGVATPSGIEGMRLLDDEQNEHAKTLLAVISSTSIQILPISVIQLLISYGQNPSTVIIVSLITTCISTVLGVILCKVFK